MELPIGRTLQELSALLQKLERARIHYTLTSVREGAVMVQVSVPGERWEIEYFPDRKPEVEVFRSDGEIAGEEAFDALLRAHTDSAA